MPLLLAIEKMKVRGSGFVRRTPCPFWSVFIYHIRPSMLTMAWKLSGVEVQRKLSMLEKSTHVETLDVGI